MGAPLASAVLAVKGDGIWLVAAEGAETPSKPGPVKTYAARACGARLDEARPSGPPRAPSRQTRSLPASEERTFSLADLARHTSKANRHSVYRGFRAPADYGDMVEHRIAPPSSERGGPSRRGTSSGGTISVWRSASRSGSGLSFGWRGAARRPGAARHRRPPAPLRAPDQAANRRTTFSSSRDTGPSKVPPFHSAPQKAIEPTEKTAPPVGVSK